MGRPKKSAPAPIEEEEISQEIPEDDPEVEEDDEPGRIPQGAVSQTDAARAALDKGYEKPAEAVAYIKATFGIDMNPQYFSAIKTRTKTAEPTAKKAKPGKRGPKPKPAAPVAAPATPTPKASSNGEAELIESLETLKPLIAAMGAEKVKRLVDLLG